MAGGPIIQLLTLTRHTVLLLCACKPLSLLARAAAPMPAATAARFWLPACSAFLCNPAPPCPWPSTYLLQKTAPDGTPTMSAHPARFSPDDKFSRERTTCKKRFGLLPTQQPAVKY